MYKKLISTFFIFLLMLPSSIEIMHGLENHEHTICTSIGEHHIHEQAVDCDEFHKQLTIFSIDFASNYDVIPTHYYTSIFIDKPQAFAAFYQSTKTTRGPPSFTA